MGKKYSQNVKCSQPYIPNWTERVSFSLLCSFYWQARIQHGFHCFTGIGQIFLINIFLITKKTFQVEMVKTVWTNAFFSPSPQFLGIRHAAGFPAGKSLVAVRIAHYNMEIYPDEIIRRFARLSVCMTPNPGKGALGS